MEMMSLSYSGDVIRFAEDGAVLVSHTLNLSYVRDYFHTSVVACLCICVDGFSSSASICVCASLPTMSSLS